MSPFAGYESFDDCVRENQDKDDPEAYCAEIQRKVEKKDYIPTREERIDDLARRLQEKLGWDESRAERVAREIHQRPPSRRDKK